MKTVFNYTKFNNEVQDGLVEAFVALSRKYMEGKSNTPEYEAANKQFSEDFMKECISAIPHAEFTGLDMLKNPMIHNDVCVKCF